MQLFNFSITSKSHQFGAGNTVGTVCGRTQAIRGHCWQCPAEAAFWPALFEVALSESVTFAVNFKQLKLRF